jgi:hypothetical protein
VLSVQHGRTVASEGLAGLPSATVRSSFGSGRSGSRGSFTEQLLRIDFRYSISFVCEMKKEDQGVSLQ